MIIRRYGQRHDPALCSILHGRDACGPTGDPGGGTAKSTGGQRGESRHNGGRHDDGCSGFLGCTWHGVSGFGGGVWSGIKDTGSGLKNTVVHPIATGKGLVVQSSHDGMLEQAGNARKSCQAGQWIRCAASSNCAVIGPLCILQDSVYDQKTTHEAENGHWTKAGGRVAWNIGSLLIPTKVPGLTKAGQVGRAGETARTVVLHASPEYRQAIEELATERRLKDIHPGIRATNAPYLFAAYEKLSVAERIKLLRAMTPQELQDLELHTRRLDGGEHADLLAITPPDVLPKMDPPNPKFDGYGMWRHFDGDLFGRDGPELGDIRQGQLGNCWCLSAMGAVVEENPGLIKNMIRKNSNDTYTVTFRDGKKTTVTSELPAMGAHVPRGGAGWPAILEKAIADRYTGGYNFLEGGDPDWAFKMLTGSPSKLYDGTKIPKAPEVHEAMSRGDAFVVGFHELPDALKTKLAHRGILSRHGYVVVDADPAKNTLTLANPWGPDTKQVVLTRRDIRRLGNGVSLMQAPTR